MLALAGHPLGFTFTFLEPDQDPPAGTLGAVIEAAYGDPGGLDRLAAASDVVTYELEGVPARPLRRLQSKVPVWPPPKALECTQDRVEEKALFRRLGIPTADHARVASAVDVGAALRRLGGPLLVKSRRLGYDGRRQARVDGDADAEAAWQAVGRAPSIAEAVVDFDRELSLIGVRGLDGATSFYPLVENHHQEGILRTSIAPAPGVAPHLQALAETMGRRILAALDHVGVLAIELFQSGERLLANEMAPRVHNSGHWTIEGALTSQFENHLRAITGLPLGSTEARGQSRMVNLTGEPPPLEALAAIPGAHVHLYGKAPRPRRKVGHVTVTGDDPGWVQDTARRVTDLVAALDSSHA